MDVPEEIGGEEGEEGNEEEEEGEEEVVEDQKEGEYVLFPRTQRTLYLRVLKGMRSWQRPPHEHCDRCGDHSKWGNRLKQLTPALSSISGEAEYAEQSVVVERAGGEIQAWAEVRKLTLKMPDLTKHVTWNLVGRQFVKDRELNIEKQAHWILDYGGFTDSGGTKFSVWSATVITFGRKQEHFDFFFDADNAKKNGQTGIFFAGEMLDPSRSPDGSGVALFAGVYPDVTDLLLTGDTGNGFRAYEMLEELSAVFQKYGYHVELANLPPGHAWNRTDARIAHMNTFLKALKAVSRVFGAESVAAAFHAASNAALTTKRTFMARSNVFFRVVPVAGDGKKVQGVQLITDMLD